MSTPRMRPLAVAWIFTRPPPATPSTSILSRLSWAFCSSFCAFCAASRMALKSGISGMSVASRGKRFEFGIGERVHHGAYVGVGEHIGANALLGHFLLVEQRRFARFVGQRDLPNGAGRTLQSERQVARPVAAERPRRLQHQLGRRVAD